MLPAHARLRRSTDFASTVRRGSRGATPTVVVHLSSTASSPAPPRVGFIVSRALGPAVVRNKVRRRLRHLVRELWADLPPGTRLVVRATPAAATAEYERLGVDLRRGVEMASAG